MTITAIIVSHANQRGLERMITILATQTRPPDETLAFCSGYRHADLCDIQHNNPHVTITEADDRNDWGHHKRATGLAAATSEYVGFFNDDDWYHPTYLDVMLHAATTNDADVVYCAWNEQPDCTFELTRSTAGNFIVRTTIGQTAGYPTTRIYENDGHFIAAIGAITRRIVKVDDRDPLLYMHNI